MAQQDYEHQLDGALYELEKANVSQECRDVIRAACGKPYTPYASHRLNVLFKEFGTILGKKNATV